MATISSLKPLLWLQLGIGVVLTALIAGFWGLQPAASFAFGAVLMFANVAALAWSTWRTLAKKSIAWTSVVIVIKYAVLLGSIFVFSRMSWFSSLAAGLGIASFIISALALALIAKNEQKEIG